MKTAIVAAPVAFAFLSLLSGCSSDKPAEVHRPIRWARVHYDQTRDTNRYFAVVQARHEVDQAFQVGGKVVARRVELGQSVRKGDVLAVIDADDYRLSADGAQRQLEAADARFRQAESDWKRMQALKGDGSVSASDEEHAKNAFDTASAAAKAQSRTFELAQNQVGYTVLRASQDGVVTNVRVEMGQVVAAGQPVVAIADDAEPEFVVDVPEERLEQFKQSRFQAFLASASGETFAVELREIAAQAAAQTRTYRARLKPTQARRLPLGASATLVAERVGAEAPAASVPATALTQRNGKPAVWAALPMGGKATARVELMPVAVRGYRNDAVLVAGPREGTIVVTAGVHKMAPGLVVAVPDEQVASPARAQAGAP
ncbi:efflux RND transporter periplasmic adaptor subunit [Lysobacter sp. KIS68-7]|uniref:efflux RND transporter periplasmic adaptor subunit n=1 Tax=Lysobacter sp. KIS68-7 TaxID=2904252 RepID=UPI001E3238C9|nr:efflux RND transporter periplasmic adaptor subunit [Lysobacter sp. KIS68-7]UHQ19382.1 efflux RND transporter periplasmic adaptor subunit [Lysobacter sp. KIS68-7]